MTPEYPLGRALGLECQLAAHAAANGKGCHAPSSAARLLLEGSVTTRRARRSNCRCREVLATLNPIASTNVSTLRDPWEMGLKRPPAPIAETDGQPGRRWQETVLQPAYLVPLSGAATGYGIMILAMTAIPIAMVTHHHELASAATVIQLHVLGMFLPSFFTGSLIARCGAIRIMLAGAMIFIGHVLMTTSGTGFVSFAAALVMLGVGWNFMYVGGTALLTTTYTPVERARAQAINDMTIFAVGLTCSFDAGGLLDVLGWQQMNLVLIPWLLAAALALSSLG